MEHELERATWLKAQRRFWAARIIGFLLFVPGIFLTTATSMEIQSEEFLERWDYVSGRSEYAVELAELVKKMPNNDALWGN